MSRLPAQRLEIEPRTAMPLSRLVAFVLAQLGVHAVMAGLRMAVPLQALREGHSSVTVGLLLALFSAIPVLFALRVGRYIDAAGYHRPVRRAAVLALLAAGVAAASTQIGQADLRLTGLGLGALSAGGAANLGLLAVQRTAGQQAVDATDRVRVFSVLGVGPPLANVIGPVMCGILIDIAGFFWAYVALSLVTGLSWIASARIPQADDAAADETPPSAARPSVFTLWRESPGLLRLLIINWLLSTCWDVHTFAVPMLGHERDFSASTIGFVLGAFTLCVMLLRLCLPFIARHLREVTVLSGAMRGSALVFLLYPLTESPWQMGLCAVVLGVTLGSAQPMVMSTLHHLTPRHRHGEALAMRSMTINLSSTLMPLLFGVLGAWTGAAALFWAVAVMVAAGSWVTRGLQVPTPPTL
jgi:predicted MFS family arabinose efflux permease